MEGMPFREPGSPAALPAHPDPLRKAILKTANRVIPGDRATLSRVLIPKCWAPCSLGRDTGQGARRLHHANLWPIPGARYHNIGGLARLTGSRADPPSGLLPAPAWAPAPGWRSV